MDVIDINAAANKAIDELSKSGQIGGEIKNINILLPNTSVDVNDEEEGLYLISFPDSILQKMLEISATSMPPVTVIFDGKRYENVGTIIDEDGMSAFAIGNMGLLGGVNTGEPFLYIVASVGDTLVCVTRGTHTIELRYETVTVKPIDPKYITKTINLADYSVTADDAETTLEALTNYILSTGTEGKRQTIDGNTRIWDDLNTESPVVIKFNFGTNPVKVAGPTIVCDSNNYPVQLCFSALADIQGNVATITIIVMPYALLCKIDMLS